MAAVETVRLDDDKDRIQSNGVSARALRDNPMTLAVSADPLVRTDGWASSSDS